MTDPLTNLLNPGPHRSIRARLPWWSWRASALALLAVALFVTAVAIAMNWR
jgi:hypothetical protein